MSKFRKLVFIVLFLNTAFALSIYPMRDRSDSSCETDKVLYLFRRLKIEDFSPEKFDERISVAFLTGTLDLSWVLRPCANAIKNRTLQTILSYMPVDRIKILNLSHNKLTTLPERLYDLEKLEILDLSHNRLTILSEKIWDLSYLNELNLAHNRLTILPKGFFVLTIENLDLSYNLFKFNFDKIIKDPVIFILRALVFLRFLHLRGYGFSKDEEEIIKKVLGLHRNFKVNFQ